VSEKYGMYEWTVDTLSNSIWFDGDMDSSHMSLPVFLACSPLTEMVEDPLENPMWIEQAARLAAWLNHIAPDGVIPVVPNDKDGKHE